MATMLIAGGPISAGRSVRPSMSSRIIWPSRAGRTGGAQAYSEPLGATSPVLPYGP
jgi:hypothetical protein